VNQKAWLLSLNDANPYSTMVLSGARERVKGEERERGREVEGKRGRDKGGLGGGRGERGGEGEGRE
jgi:hypothetical protein